MKKYLPILLIFLLGIILRFIYFPENIYFGYDQARDVFTAISLLQGHLKLIGPPSSFNSNIFHGPLIYYLYAPFLWLFSGNIETISAFFRVYNAFGVFLTYLIGTIIFNKRVGVFSALLFAISFEESQYALFLGHPALAVIPVLTYYLGLTWLIFRREWKGLPLAAVSLGLAIQFHYINILLLLGLIVTLTIFYQEIKNTLNWRYTLFTLSGFFLSISPFLISEIKYNFRLFQAALSTVSSLGGMGDGMNFSYGVMAIQRFVNHNFIFEVRGSLIVITVLAAGIIWLIHNGQYRKKGIFILIWLLGGILPYLVTKTPSYYFGAGASVSLLILAAFILDKLWKKFPLAALLILLAFVFSNLKQEMDLNKKGPNLDMVIQPQMLISDEKKTLDYIYQDAKGKPLAVRSLGVPLSVNTTWSYLFEWYGKSRYGYLPAWIGPVASGYAGNLTVNNDRGSLPAYYYLIVEPTVGIREGIKEQFFEEEGYFTKVVEEKQFGEFKVQKRERY